MACDSSGGSYELKMDDLKLNQAEAEQDHPQGHSAGALVRLKSALRRSRCAPCPLPVGGRQTSVASGHSAVQSGTVQRTRTESAARHSDQLARRTRWGFSADGTTLPPFPRLRPPRNSRYRKNSFGFWTLRYSSTTF